MALQKQPFNVNFAQGLDTKTDRYQVPAGKFLALENSVFDTTLQLKKRNGFEALTALPDSSATTLTTFKESLVAVGTSLQSLSEDASQWIDKGSFQPVDLSVLSVMRSSSSQTAPDLAVSMNGYSCTTWTDSDGLCYYRIFDTLTGQGTVQPQALPTGAVFPRCCLLGRYFVVTFLVTITAVTHLQYIAIPVTTPSVPGSAVDLTSQAKDLSAGYDIHVSNNNMYWAVNASDGGGAVRMGWIDSGLLSHSPVVIAGKTASLISLTSDETGSTPVIWLSIYAPSTAYVAAYSPYLVQILAPTSVATAITINKLTSVAKDSVLTLLYQVENTYSYSSVRSDYVASRTISIGGSVSAQTIRQRGVGLGSKAFLYNSDILTLLAYSGAFQPTYFLYSLTSGVIAKLAYGNGGGYSPNQVLSFVTVDEDQFSLAYSFKDLIVSVNKSQDVDSVGGTFSQTGVNVATFEINQGLDAREIGRNLHLTGGFLWMYDGDRPVEHSFHVWPEDLAVTTSGTGGLLTAQSYSYQAVYTWTDNQGNIHRSAPSVPVSITTAGTTSSNTINIPTLRLTRKTSQNKVRIELFRFSAAQQSFYLVTSITAPLLNDTTTDSVSFVDTLADSAILGNPLIYTTGNVVENIAMPAVTALANFKSRLFGVSAEDEDLIVYSKQVVEGVPVEPTDLFTIYLNPTLAPAGTNSRGTVLVPLDDKLIFMKSGALYYISGTGPDNTGANNDFSEPVLITSAVGCSNKKSIAITPAGIQFQSPNKGIWLLGRDLSTTYVGAPVEAYNDIPVTSALAVPGTNQVRYTLDNNKALMFDYLMNQWGTFTNVNAISSTIYGGKHTYLDSSGRILQEKKDFYLDRTTPVCLAFSTSWLALAGLQGFQRFYVMNLLGKYLSPHILVVEFSYDYDDAVAQTIVIHPTNYSGPYGSDSIYGGSVTYGGNTRVEDWQIYPQLQKCESFKVSVREIYDPSLGVAAGAGLTISGLNLVLGLKKGYPTKAATQTAG